MPTMSASTVKRLAALLLLSIPVFPAWCAQPVVGDEAIERPPVRVGDVWVYRQTSLINRKGSEFSYRVTALGADRITTTADGHSDVYSADWNLIESSAGIKISPHEGYFSFPLEPGKSYPFKAVHTVARLRSTWEGTVTVQDWETVDVPAGRFRALRVNVAGSFGSGPVARRAQLQHSYWWSAGVRRWVRHDLWMSKPDGKTTDFHTRTELIRYTPAP